MSHRRRNGHCHGNPLVPRELQDELRQAEAEAEWLLSVTKQLNDLPHARRLIVLGEIVCQLPYSEGGPTDSARLFQAALMVPQGIGAVCWDTEQIELHDTDLEARMAAAKRQFIPFRELPATIRAKLIRCSAALVTRLFSIIDGNESA